MSTTIMREKIKEKAADIRLKRFGKDVREAMATGVELSGETAADAMDKVDIKANEIDEISKRIDKSVTDSYIAISAANDATTKADIASTSATMAAVTANDAAENANVSSELATEAASIATASSITADQAAAKANASADNADKARTSIETKLANGEFIGPQGVQGPPGDLSNATADRIKTANGSNVEDELKTKFFLGSGNYQNPYGIIEKSNSNLNNMIHTGIFEVSSEASNIPHNKNNWYVEVISKGPMNVKQIARSTENNQTFERTKLSTWSIWEAITGEEVLYQTDQPNLVAGSNYTIQESQIRGYKNLTMEMSTIATSPAKPILQGVAIIPVRPGYSYMSGIGVSISGSSAVTLGILQVQIQILNSATIKVNIASLHQILNTSANNIATNLCITKIIGSA